MVYFALPTDVLTVSDALLFREAVATFIAMLRFCKLLLLPSARWVVCCGIQSSHDSAREQAGFTRPAAKGWARRPTGRGQPRRCGGRLHAVNASGWLLAAVATQVPQGDTAITREIRLHKPRGPIGTVCLDMYCIQTQSEGAHAPRGPVHRTTFGKNGLEEVDWLRTSCGG